MDDQDMQAVRARYRQQLVPLAVYSNPPVPRPASGQPAERSVEMNFMAGRDMPEGATHFRHLAKAAMVTLAANANAMAHLAKIKPARKIKQFPAGMDITMTLEELVSQPRTTDGFVKVIGVRVRWGMEPAAAHLPALQNAEQAEAAGAAAAADAGAPAERPARRGRGRNARQERDDEDTHAEGDVDEVPEEGRVLGPLALALCKSFAESADIERAIAKERRAASEGRRDPYGLTFTYAHISNQLGYFFDYGKKFMENTALGDADPDDPRGWTTLVDGEGAESTRWNRMSFSNPKHPMHPDSIFSKESAVFYKRTHDAHAQQWRLSSYSTDAAAVDDSSLASLLTADQDGVWRSSVPDRRFPDWPFPLLVYTVNANAMLAEVLVPYVCFPHAMGTWLPPAMLDARMPEESVLARLTRPVHWSLQSETMSLQTLEDLAAHEEQHQKRARPVVIGHGTGDRMRMERVRTDAPSLAEAEALSPERRIAQGTLTALTDERRKEMRIQQLNAVRDALRTLALHYRKPRRSAYPEFSAHPPAILPASSHTTVSAAELLANNADAADAHLSRTAQQLMHELTHQLGMGGMNVTDADARMQVGQQVDSLPQWMVDRNAFLQLRQRVQLRRAVFDYRVERGRIDLARAQAEDDAATPESAAVAMAAYETEWRQKRRELLESQRAEFDKLFRTTDLASDSLLEARDYALKHFMNQARGAVVDTILEGRPFLSVMQFYTDIFVHVDQVAYQNIPYVLRALVCSMNAHRWKPRRSLPAPNYALTGPSGAGKSFALLTVTNAAPPGIVQNLTAMTTASFNVDKDFDNQILIQEEIDTSLLFTNQKGNDSGATDKANYAKARMSSFCTVTQYFYQDEDTKQRLPAKCYSSQHLVFMGATNQNLEKIDAAVARRLLIDFIAENMLDSEGGNPTDIDTFDIFAQNAAGQRAQNVLRELHCAYMYVESGIKAGVFDDVLEDGARTILYNALEYAHERRRVPIKFKTKKHWLMEAARTYAIIEACFSALFLPDAALLYERPADHGGILEDEEAAAAHAATTTATAAESDGRIDRWSWRMFDKLVVSQALRVTKDHMIMACTAFDFLFASRTEEQLLHTIATKICHVAEPPLWHFRKLSVMDRNTITYDYNYLAIAGPSKMKICGAIADLNKHNAGLRAEDIWAMLCTYEKQFRDTRTLQPGYPGGDATRAPDRLYYDDRAGNQLRAAMFFEPEPAAGGRVKPNSQMCISIDFICSRFGLSIEQRPDELRKALERNERHLDGAQLQMADAVSLGECTDERSPLVEALRVVLSNRTLEHSPYEHATCAPLPDLATRYMTFYTPDQVVIDFENGAQRRVPLHGAHLMVRLKRDPDGPLLKHRNYNRPTPTARSNVYGIGTGASTDPIGQGLNEARGFKIGTHDVDYTMTQQQMERNADTGLRYMERLYVRALSRETGKSEEAVRAALPPMSADQPLPWAYAPIRMRIMREALRILRPAKPVFGNYPAINIFQRLSDTADRYHSESNKTLSAFKDLETMVDRRIQNSALYDAFREKAVRNKRPRPTATADAVEQEAARARTRPRLAPTAQLLVTTRPAPASAVVEDAMDIDGVPPSTDQLLADMANEEQEEEEDEEMAVDFDD